MGDAPLQGLIIGAGHFGISSWRHGGRLMITL